MNWRVWEQVEAILAAREIKPILAVIPDNRDPKLEASPPDPAFWDRVGHWCSLGWSIALHGYQHLLAPAPKGLIPLHAVSEFTGLPLEIQLEKVQTAMAIFREHAVEPAAWAAPAHSFDRVTLSALTSAGIRVISDGFFPLPHVDRFGMLWIPQQLWRFRQAPAGVLTVCLHVNSWVGADIVTFERQLDRFAGSIATLGEVIAKYRSRRENVGEQVLSKMYVRLLTARHRLVAEDRG
jgi:peptidoglycan/xylan/chitin deacetylase (PgdA/CDA1 family)